jgi:hypothetical protein
MSHLFHAWILLYCPLSLIQRFAIDEFTSRSISGHFVYASCLGQSAADEAFEFSPSYAIWQDGHERMFEIVKSEDFIFVVNGACFAGRLAEAVLVSSAGHALLQ